jgi:DNA-binding XRE family transcriptional regulator
MVRYITGVNNKAVQAVAHEHSIGLLVTPDTARSLTRHIAGYPFWAADNACFNHPEDFDADKYLAWLSTFPLEQRSSCLFAPAPDVVGDAVKTLERSAPVLPLIRSLGFKAALVAQDGLENLTVPWDELDVLFIGGSTEWKLSPAARELSAEAKRRGKRIHMGRVNSFKRLKIADDFGCDTADGTYLAFGPTINLPRLLGWLNQLSASGQPSPDVTECLIMTGKELKRMRERAELSQAALAVLAEIHPRTIMRWELGQVPIPRLEALGLVALFGSLKGKK